MVPSNNLVHQSGVSHFSAFHGTHWLNSKTTWALEVSYHLHPQRSPAILSGRRPLHWLQFWWLIQVRAFTSGSLLTGSCFWVRGAAGGRLVFKLHLAASPLLLFPDFIPGSPYSWISSLVLSGSRCEPACLSPPQG